MDVLRCTDVIKSYPRFQLGPVSLYVQKGEILGLVGRNGAGKSTLLKAVLNLIQLDSGKIELNLPITATGPRRRQWIGAISNLSPFYGWMTVRKALAFNSSFYPRWNNTLSTNLLQEFHLDPEAVVDELSTGNLLKLGLVACLSQGATLLILDEPTSGLDPVVREEFLSLVCKTVQNGMVDAAIFASHVLAEVEGLCTRVVVLNQGLLTAELSLAPDPIHNLSFQERCLAAMR